MMVDAVRHFNRFYTRHIGLLERSHLQSDFSLTEVRVLYELAHDGEATATRLKRALGLDGGYLSRILAGFERRGLLRKKLAAGDARQSLLELTRRGRTLFSGLDQRASQRIRALLAPLPSEDQRRLADAMRDIEGVLSPRESEAAPYIIRPPRAGELGWVVQRHGAIYAEEYGWNEEFEGLCAEIVAHYVASFDARRERCFIAERHGHPVGSVFLVKRSETVGQLRLLLVEPSARGLGVGARLIDECTRFARQAGYRKVALWTNSELTAARRLYERAGYKLVQEKPHHSWGQDHVGQTWELDLATAP
jgi:DNA-binding MarR family transcriptional regulator/GNAT superfamily N-acetyltransferase